MLASLPKLNHAASSRQGVLMSFGIYAAGYAILICGLLYAAHLMHMPSHWMIAGGVVLIGIGLLSAVKATRQKDPAN
jgi:hypothetical protein